MSIVINYIIREKVKGCSRLLYSACSPRNIRAAFSIGLVIRIVYPSLIASPFLLRGKISE